MRSYGEEREEEEQEDGEEEKQKEEGNKLMNEKENKQTEKREEEKHEMEEKGEEEEENKIMVAYMWVQRLYCTRLLIHSVVPCILLAFPVTYAYGFLNYQQTRPSRHK